MAAGLSLEEKDVEDFRREINEVCTLTESDMEERIHIDVPMPVSHVSMEFVKELELLEPFGKGNTKPVFAGRNIELLNGKILGKNKNVLKLRVRDEQEAVIDAVYFGNLETFSETLCRKYGAYAMDALLSGDGKGMKLSLTYYPDINEYRGKKSPQIVNTHCQ